MSAGLAGPDLGGLEDVDFLALLFETFCRDEDEGLFFFLGLTARKKYNKYVEYVNEAPRVTSPLRVTAPRHVTRGIRLFN